MNAKAINKHQEDSHIPSGLLLQWHITERCNLSCSHCYQENISSEELSLNDLIKILGQYKKLLEAWRSKKFPEKVKGHITVTGGEPFIRKDFIDLLEILSANKEHFSFAILTNGTYLDKEMANRLHKLAPNFVQVSVEGKQETHDKIRGKGNFKKTVSALKYLVRKRVQTLISFTAHRGNYQEFIDVARLGMKLGVSRVWADRLIPYGKGSALCEQVMTPDETRQFFRMMNKSRYEVMASSRSQTEVAMHRALQFLVSAGAKDYHCSAGDTLITVMPNGDLYPCRRMPIRVGNVLETPLIDLYYDSELLCALRDQSIISDGCQDCSHQDRCRGGLKCLSYAITGDPFKADPGCWLRNGVSS